METAMTSDEADVRLGVIGGSGLYAMDELQDVSSKTIVTPYGMPSDDILLGTLRGTRVAFLPRHGRGHRFTPSEVPYRANIWALKSLGVPYILSVSAVGSMKENIEPGHMVLVDQFIDRTTDRARSFFGDGIAGHVTFADPICETLRGYALESARKTKATIQDRGTYICIEGPTFSTRAESMLFRSWGVDVIGMTNLPEARLAREAGMSYATLALATDYDCWHEEEENVSVEAVIATLKNNVANAQDVITNLAERLGADDVSATSPVADASKHAVMTAPDAIPVEARRRMALLIQDQLG